MDLEVPVEIDLKDFKKKYQEAAKAGKKNIKYKNIDFYTDYAKYLIEYVEGQGKSSFKISQRDIPKK